VRGHAERWDEVTVDADPAARDCLVRYKQAGRTLAFPARCRELPKLTEAWSCKPQPRHFRLWHFSDLAKETSVGSLCGVKLFDSRWRLNISQYFNHLDSAVVPQEWSCGTLTELQKTQLLSARQYMPAFTPATAETVSPPSAAGLR
jgi:hypothetical protein